MVKKNVEFCNFNEILCTHDRNIEIIETKKF